MANVCTHLRDRKAEMSIGEAKESSTKLDKVALNAL